MTEEHKQDYSGIIPAIIGCALPLGPGVIALIGSFQIRKFENIFDELGVAIPVITQMLFAIGDATIAIILVIIIVWPIITLLIKKKCSEGLGVLMLLNGMIAVAIGGLITVGLFLPLVVTIESLGG